MNRKTMLLILTIILIILTLILIKTPLKKLTPTGNYLYTKAICNDSNYCEDHIVECSGTKTKSLTPTGLSIQQPKDWQDPRENSKELCN